MGGGDVSEHSKGLFQQHLSDVTVWRPGDALADLQKWVELYTADARISPSSIQHFPPAQRATLRLAMEAVSDHR